ncbi:MAG: uroporphyrinogen-III synthase [Sulfuriflexus sp.]|nr:uroporphyrinogen-III synthase [Sulfuriflexus sp.]
MSNRLQNIRVMVTRPVEQAADLIEQINNAGGQASNFPTLEIQASSDAESVERCKFVAGYDWVIFISQNAVRYSLSLLPISAWPLSTYIAAVGPTTSNALQQAGLQVNRQPDNAMNSEALLVKFANEELTAKKILIVRGVGGRETLANGLRAMGALVDYAEVYSRHCPDHDNAHLLQQLEDGIDIVTIASGETLQNFADIIENSSLNDQQKKKLYSCPLVIVSERIKGLAEQLGFSDTVVVNEPENKGVVNAIEEWLNKK